ncbi:MAG: ribonucleoside hydrolase RihC [Oscillospiraceae bacterium]
MVSKKQIIIDTDPGIDDAIAIAVALFSEKLEVKLMTTVVGNVSVDKVTTNALKLMSFFNKNIPVAKGADTPLLREVIDASDVHGSTGMDGYDFPEPASELLLGVHAVEAMRQVILESDDNITIMAIGPLTNIALLIKMYPDLIKKIDELVIMGGALGRGNKGPLSEFNIAVDPEAAKIVFESGLKIVMAGLEVGLKALVYPEDSEIIKTLNSTGDMIYNLFKKYRGGSFNTGLKMYDSCAVAYLLKPELYEFRDVYVGVETKGELTSGATVVDLKGELNKKPNVKVCFDIDGDKFREWLIESLSKCI